MKKTLDFIFVILIFSLLWIPGVMTYFSNQTISEDENRALTKQPVLWNQDSKLNHNFALEYDQWIGDNVGFRKQFVSCYALTQYYCFHNLASEGMYLGRNDDLNYADRDMLLDYSHLNLRTSEELKTMTDDFQYVSDWLREQGIQFYFMQCYDKHSIYPEQYMDYVNQYGDRSKADQLQQSLHEHTDVRVVPTKTYLLQEKEKRKVYSNWGDPTHWNEWGALTGYQALMDTINENSAIQYKVLKEEEYRKFDIDYGKTLNGIIHRVDVVEAFDLMDIRAIPQDQIEVLGRFAQDTRHKIFLNPEVKNDTKTLLLSDSYIDSYILDDIAEGFSETAMVWSDNINSLDELIDLYQPDIVIFEFGERRDRSYCLSELSNKLRER